MANVVPIGCDVRVQVVIIDGRYIRWRCRENHCPDAITAKRHGTRAFHIYDLETGEQRTEYEAQEKRGHTEAA